MSRRRTKYARLIAALVTASGLGSLLAGCSDPGLYWDHRETVALSGGDAVAANTITQMVDPWPPNSGNKTIPYNGQKMQVAVERYRTGTTIPPISAVTSDAALPPPVAPPLPLATSGGQAAISGAATAAAALQ